MKVEETEMMTSRLRIALVKKKESMRNPLLQIRVICRDPCIYLFSLFDLISRDPTVQFDTCKHGVLLFFVVVVGGNSCKMVNPIPTIGT